MTLNDAALDNLHSMFRHARAEGLVDDATVAAAEKMIADARRGDDMARDFCRETLRAFSLVRSHEGRGLAMPGAYAVALSYLR